MGKRRTTEERQAIFNQITADTKAGMTLKQAVKEAGISPAYFYQLKKTTKKRKPKYTKTTATSLQQGSAFDNHESNSTKFAWSEVKKEDTFWEGVKFGQRIANSGYKIVASTDVTS